MKAEYGSHEGDGRVVLRLYVAGTNPRSLRAVERVTRLCTEYFADRCDLEVIDIYQDPARAEEAQVIAAPTLVRLQPKPIRHVVGDLTDEPRVLLALGFRDPK